MAPSANYRLSLLRYAVLTIGSPIANHLAEQIRRLESSTETDPSLAIGTAKELIETCCKTILAERGKPVDGTSDVSTLTKQTTKELRLVPEEIPDSARGSDVIKRLLSNLGTIGNGLAELRGLYGTGHGKHGINRLERTPRKIGRWCGIHTDSLSFRDTHGNKSKIGVWDKGWRELAPYRTGSGSPPSLFDLLGKKLLTLKGNSGLHTKGKIKHGLRGHHSNWSRRNEADAEFFADFQNAVALRAAFHERILALDRSHSESEELADGLLA